MTADFVSDSIEQSMRPRPRLGVARRRWDWKLVAGGALAALVLAWILFFAGATSAGAAIDEPGEFVVTLLDGLTLAGLYFIVASGFTLIFGLMRTVNMAHGSLFLLAAYVAVEVQQRMVGKTRNITADDVDMWSWILPLLIGAFVAAVVGFVIFEIFLRWNHGQELRQALITLAISIILADQLLAHAGGLAQSMAWPQGVTHFVEIFGERCTRRVGFRTGDAVVVGGALWLWLNRTRMGIVIRAGVADEQMVRALGINIGIVFAITFFVGSFLAGMGGVMVASFAGVATGADGQWLLHSLVVVIIGGLGSIRGAVAGALLYGMVSAFAPVYLPSGTPTTRSSSRSRAAGDRAGDATVRPVRAARVSTPTIPRPRTLVVATVVALLVLMPFVGTEFFVNFVLHPDVDPQGPERRLHRAVRGAPPLARRRPRRGDARSGREHARSARAVRRRACQARARGRRRHRCRDRRHRLLRRHAPPGPGDPAPRSTTSWCG